MGVVGWREQGERRRVRRWEEGKRVAYDIEVRRRFAENAVHFFEGAVGSLGIEKVDHGEDEGINDSEDNVGLVFDGGESNGCDHYDHEVESPVRGRG